MSVGEREQGIVNRLDDDSLGYINVDGRSLSFTAEEIENYKGQPFADLGIIEGASVGFLREKPSRILQIFPVHHNFQIHRRKTFHGDSVTPSKGTEVAASFDIPPPNEEQGELHPATAPTARRRPGRALPEKTRRFGKLIDTSLLQAGDLLLTRDLTQENWISKSIAEVQSRIGYGPTDSHWIHAAMYLGDGAHVVEATIDSFLSGGSVRITHLDDYCDGTNILRFRRSTFIKQERDGWLVCIRALSRLGKPYSIGQALKAWWDVRVGGAVAFDPTQKNILADGIVCSTLYADSFNRALRLSLGEDNGICVPAWFSATNDFVDVKVDWLAIA
jgi:cell wall-associated NlpC family hydrolase